MDTPLDSYNTRYIQLVEEASTLPLTDESTTQAMKNLEIFSKCRPPEPAPEPESIPEPVLPTKFWGKTLAGAARVLDNETTRVVIKAGGAFAGVAFVAYSTIYKDHVLERQALAQANTIKPS